MVAKGFYVPKEAPDKVAKFSFHGQLPAELKHAAVLSGNWNFEGRVHPQTKANYFASPPLVVAYALSGTVNIVSRLVPKFARYLRTFNKRYKVAGHDTIVLAGADYGSGSSGDWLPRVQCCCNLVGMGIILLCFNSGQFADTLVLTGHERYTIDPPSKISEIKPGQEVTVKTDTGKSFTCIMCSGIESFLTVEIFHSRVSEICVKLVINERPLPSLLLPHPSPPPPPSSI
ncbi:hypothetical protein Dsin_031656 [Dipteronia sinensis]|uniref:Aconitase/3-isopropylmalate dehydratase large subunit alpha/beta/alpha domain-containing protein n=1 Tax=Dipteronia sinensis TaxID=43782 RepID=A0AAE0DTK7_9ROSI|nr:hypothetical protein Dsin_031656 [Dipteronia sinensis]